MKKVLCERQHRMIEIVLGLLLCECSSYGPLVSRKGAVEEARQLVRAQGGIAFLRDRIEAKERADIEKRKEDKAEGLRALRNSIHDDTADHRQLVDKDAG